MAEKIISSLGGSAPARPDRDFGLLKVRNLKVKQSQANIVQSAKEGTHFDRMSHDRLFDIVNQDDIQQKRNLSRWFFKKNGMYARAVRYIADIYKFDYMVYPNVAMDDELKEEKQKKIIKKWDEVLEHFDISDIQDIIGTKASGNYITSNNEIWKAQTNYKFDVTI